MLRSMEYSRVVNILFSLKRIVLRQAVTHNLYNFHKSISSLHDSNRRVSISFCDPQIDTEEPEEHHAVSMLSLELRCPSHPQQSPFSSHLRPSSCESPSHCHQNIRSVPNQLQILSCLSSYKSRRVRSWYMQLVLCFAGEIWGRVYWAMPSLVGCRACLGKLVTYPGRSEFVSYSGCLIFGRDS